MDTVPHTTCAWEVLTSPCHVLPVLVPGVAAVHCCHGAAPCRFRCTSARLPYRTQAALWLSCPNPRNTNLQFAKPRQPASVPPQKRTSRLPSPALTTPPSRHLLYRTLDHHEPAANMAFRQLVRSPTYASAPNSRSPLVLTNAMTASSFPRPHASCRAPTPAARP